MNIISNSCVGAFLLRDYYKQEYNNPFIWSYVDIKSFYNLIKYYDSIKWYNYELIKDDNWNFSIIIDNKIKVEYPHYHFKATANNIEIESTIIQRDIYYNKIWEYIVEKYISRINKLINCHEEPIFLLATKYEFNEMHNYDTKYLKLIDELDTKYNTILISKYFIFNNKKYYNFKNSNNNIELAEEIYNMNIF